MFEYNVGTSRCKFHPHTALKSLPWAEVAERTSDSTADVGLYVLQCSTATEDLLDRHQWANQVGFKCTLRILRVNFDMCDKYGCINFFFFHFVP